MTRKFLQIVGALTVLSILGAGAVAAFFVKQRFLVTVTDEAGSRKAGPDPVALLRDDVAVLRADLTGLATALSRSFETLAAQSEDRDGARALAFEAQVARLSASVAGLSERLTAFSADSARSESRSEAARRAVLAGLSAHEAAFDRLLAEISVRARATAAPLARDTAAVAPPPQPPSSSAPPSPGLPPPTRLAPDAASPTQLPPPGPPPPAPPASAPGIATPTSTATGGAAPPTTPGSAPARTPTPPTPAKKKGFLSFALPSDNLDFSQRLRFEIVPSLSRVGFDAKSTLHDFSGVTSGVSGSFTARLPQPGAGTAGLVRADATTIDTGEKDRDAEMRTALDTAKFPAIDFQLTAFEVATVDAGTYASSGTARGKMTIHGVTRDVAIPLRISVDESRRVMVEGEAPLNLTDYGVAPPRKMGIISVDNQVRIWLSLRARAAGKAE